MEQQKKRKKTTSVTRNTNERLLTLLAALHPLSNHKSDDDIIKKQYKPQTANIYKHQSRGILHVAIWNTLWVYHIHRYHSQAYYKDFGTSGTWQAWTHSVLHLSARHVARNFLKNSHKQLRLACYSALGMSMCVFKIFQLCIIFE